MTETNNDNMNAVNEAVKSALLGVTQDSGCSAQTLELITQAIKIWDETELEACASYKKQIAELSQQLGAANDMIQTLHAKIEDQNRERIQQMSKHAAFVQNAGDREERDRHNLRHWRENCGKLDSQVKGLKDQLRATETQCHIAVDGLTQARDILKSMEARLRRSISIEYDKAANEFVVCFRTGQQLHFERPKQVAGNVENWLATLRHQVASSPE